MKNILFFFSALLLCTNAISKDKIILKGGQTIKGEILQLEQNKVIISDGSFKLEFTPEHVEFIEFDVQNPHIAKIIAENAEFTYLDGKADAKLYHKRGGGNFALGFFFGVFGFIGVAVGNVQDPPAVIPDFEQKVNSSDYREGYRKGGKGKNLGAAGAGWAAGFILLLIISAASGG